MNPDNTMAVRSLPKLRRVQWLLIGACFWLSTQATVGAIPRVTDPDILNQGRDLFKTHCAICHGANAEGTTPNWKQRDAQGNLPPPPLNGTAHAWHHSLYSLMHTIRQGTLSIGGNMPAWSREILSDDDIFAIIIWFSSLWPDELFEYWMEMNRAESSDN